MTERHFQLRLDCRYQGTENTLDSLKLESLKDGAWEELSLDIRSPGFLLFINGLFSCQHLYMRTNCAERGLIIDSASGELRVSADETWHISKTWVTFRVKLRSGEPSENDIAYIIERMGHCPVSSNLPEHILQEKTLEFEPV